MAGTGKISALPRAVRDQLARRLDDGATGADVLPWLNELPEVKAVLAAKGWSPVTDQNLSNWRETGLALWQRERERTARHRELAEYARQLGDDAADIFAGGGAIAGGVLMEVLDELDTEGQKALLADKPENLPAMINALARLQSENTKRGMARLKADQVKLLDSKLKLEREKFENATLEKLLKKAASAEVQSIVTSSKPRGEKMKQLRFVLWGDQGAKNVPQI